MSQEEKVTPTNSSLEGITILTNLKLEENNKFNLLTATKIIKETCGI
jgi:hypothetical protein